MRATVLRAIGLTAAARVAVARVVRARRTVRAAPVAVGTTVRAGPASPAGGRPAQVSPVKARRVRARPGALSPVVDRGQVPGVVMVAPPARVRPTGRAPTGHAPGRAIRPRAPLIAIADPTPLLEGRTGRPRPADPQPRVAAAMGPAPAVPRDLRVAISRCAPGLPDRPRRRGPSASGRSVVRLPAGCRRPSWRDRRDTDRIAMRGRHGSSVTVRTGIRRPGRSTAPRGLGRTLGCRRTGRHRRTGRGVRTAVRVGATRPRRSAAVRPEQATRRQIALALNV